MLPTSTCPWVTTYDQDDVALKNLAIYFLHQSREKREHAEKLMMLQNQQGSQIIL
jgi:ferritin